MFLRQNHVQFLVKFIEVYTPSESTSSNYFKKVTLTEKRQFLDHLNSELKNRFDATTVISYEGTYNNTI